MSLLTFCSWMASFSVHMCFCHGVAFADRLTAPSRISMFLRLQGRWYATLRSIIFLFHMVKNVFFIWGTLVCLARTSHYHNAPFKSARHGVLFSQTKVEQAGHSSALSYPRRSRTTERLHFQETLVSTTR